MTRRNSKYVREGLEFNPEEGRTKQALRSTSVETMMAKFNRESDLVPISRVMAQYGDFSEIGDFQSAMEQVTAAQARFMALPSKVRSMVHNSAGEYIEWITDPKNFERAVELKLLNPTPTEAEIPVVRVLQEPEGVPDPKPE